MNQAEITAYSAVDRQSELDNASVENRKSGITIPMDLVTVCAHPASRFFVVF